MFWRCSKNECWLWKMLLISILLFFCLFLSKCSLDFLNLQEQAFSCFPIALFHPPAIFPFEQSWRFIISSALWFHFLSFSTTSLFLAIPPYWVLTLGFHKTVAYLHQSMDFLGESSFIVFLSLKDPLQTTSMNLHLKKSSFLVLSCLSWVKLGLFLIATSLRLISQFLHKFCLIWFWSLRSFDSHHLIFSIFWQFLLRFILSLLQS